MVEPTPEISDVSDEPGEASPEAALKAARQAGALPPPEAAAALAGKRPKLPAGARHHCGRAALRSAMYDLRLWPTLTRPPVCHDMHMG